MKRFTRIFDAGCGAIHFRQMALLNTMITEKIRTSSVLKSGLLQWVQFILATFLALSQHICIVFMQTFDVRYLDMTNCEILSFLFYYTSFTPVSFTPVSFTINTIFVDLKQFVYFRSDCNKCEGTIDHFQNLKKANCRTSYLQVNFQQTSVRNCFIYSSNSQYV